MDPRTILQPAIQQLSPEYRLRRVLRGCFIAGACSVLFLTVQFAAQEPPPAQAAPASPSAGTLATLRGVVRNAATGQPLPRALVRIEGDAEAGALTDGDGRFEIPGVPTGPQAIQVIKPGYRDRPNGAGAAADEDTIGPAHNVQVAAEMPELVFTLAPTSSIHGQIELSTGDPAQGITINLLRQTVQDGRAAWTPAAITRTDSEGAYRFASLAGGVYVMYTEPALDSDPAVNLFSAGASGRAGYASIFFPDARDLAGAARIQLSSGEQAQANLTLTLEPFQNVSAAIALAQILSSASGPAETDYSAVIMDAAGHQLPYRASYVLEAHTIQILLPDGTYSLLISTIPRQVRQSLLSNSEADQDAGLLVGTVDFSVAGHEVPNLRVTLSVPHPNPVELAIVRTALAPASSGAAPSKAGQIQVMLSPADGQAGGWIGEGMVSAYANGSEPGPMETNYLLPGAYWVHTHIDQKGLCEESFTAGGANLAREPVILGLSGSMAPMTLTLRDDCANLTLSLPQALMAQAPGDEHFYTVYVVPDFDSTVDVTPSTLRPSSGGTVTLENLTPGEYHVYAFPATARLKYRNPAVLAALPNQGQSVSLSPGTTANLVLEAPLP
ncbi:MAG: carboxypeptidase-like regulatory domain-containing protein [Terracidiphilus sp.]